MSLACRKRYVLLVALACLGTAEARELRVCADPNNLPFSDENRAGFENRIVEIVANDLNANVTYTWFAQRRGFLRNTLNAGVCDLVPGVPAGMDMLRTTRPYYRSSYVIVRQPNTPVIASLDDPALKRVKIGVQLIGSNGANSPPVHELARRGIVDNVRGFMIYGNCAGPAPAPPIISAVSSGEIDVAIVWGPPGGYFASKEIPPLEVEPLSSNGLNTQLPVTFDIAMGVRKREVELAAEIDRSLLRHRREIDAILAAYRVPVPDGAYETTREREAQ